MSDYVDTTPRLWLNGQLEVLERENADLRRQLAGAQAREQEFRDRLGPEWSEWLGRGAYFCDWCDAAKNDGHTKDCPWFILGQPDQAALVAALRPCKRS